MTLRSLGLVMTGVAIAAGCTVPVESVENDDAITQTSAASSAVVARVSGSGHVMRNLTGEDELTTFSYNATARADGTAHGKYQYHFRAADFFIHGTVTCASVAGNAGWVGGVIDKIVSGDPADQSLVGTEIWWRVVDNGEGANAAADLTTSLLFAVPGLPITAESWCRNQDVRGVMRDVLHGNIQVR
jgi:hypothetical protein